MPRLLLRGRRESRILVDVTCSLIGILVVACGSPTIPEAPSHPSLPADAGLLHVVQANGIATFRIEARTARLTSTGTYSLARVQSLAADPAGRFLYAGIASDADGTGGRLLSLSVDRRSGTLALVAEAPAGTCDMTWWGGAPKCEWLWLLASESRVAGSWLHHTYHDEYYHFLAYPVGSGGALGAPVEAWFEDNVGRSVADARVSTLYAAEFDELVRYTIEADGTIARRAASRACGANGLSFDTRPLAAGDEILFSDTPAQQRSLLCSHQGEALASRDAVENAAPLTAAAYRSPREGQGALLALARGYELQLAAVDAEGRIRPPSSLRGTTQRARELLFHPAGQLLFALGSSAVSVFALDGAEPALLTRAAVDTGVPDIAVGTRYGLDRRGGMAITP